MGMGRKKKSKGDSTSPEATPENILKAKQETIDNILRYQEKIAYLTNAMYDIMKMKVDMNWKLKDLSELEDFCKQKCDVVLNEHESLLINGTLSKSF
jgi:hypothetical protein